MNLKDWWWGRGKLRQSRELVNDYRSRWKESQATLENYRRMASVHLEKDIGRAAIRHVELARSSWDIPVATLSGEQISEITRVEYGMKAIGASVTLGLPETLGRESVPLVAAQLAAKFNADDLERMLTERLMEDSQ